jgi:UDP-N-acetylglucosamine 4-epimerase
VRLVENYTALQKDLTRSPKTWLVTGAAGFIGSHLTEVLLGLGQYVVGVDNFSTGKRENLDQVKHVVTPDQWNRFNMIEGDICDIEVCRRACFGVTFVLHQAALGSVPRSLSDPVSTNSTNVGGFLNMLVSAVEARVKRFVYAASSSTYGDHPDLPKREDRIGNPLSPYAVTKLVNELYAQVFASNFDIRTVGLRYFNVFGKRQDPQGAYAAVIPKWILGLLEGRSISINGDGQTSRDFCYVDNVVQANLLSAVSEDGDALSQVYNVAVGEQTSLNGLYDILKEICLSRQPDLRISDPVYLDFRRGDVRHSRADISKIKRNLGYNPAYDLRRGLLETVDWFISASHPKNGRT